MVEEAKSLGIPYEKEMGWLKAVNSSRNSIHGVARDVKVRIGDWHGTLDFFVVPMDNYKCVLGVEFIDRVKAIPMIFANSLCITKGGGTCVVLLLRGKSLPSNTLATMHVEMHEPSSATHDRGDMGGGPNDEDVMRIEWRRVSLHKSSLPKKSNFFREVAYRGRFSRCNSLRGEGKLGGVRMAWQVGREANLHGQLQPMQREGVGGNYPAQSMISLVGPGALKRPIAWLTMVPAHENARCHGLLLPHGH
ncbi:hypothetical protein GH714_031785 [Hevea brasiliensis]|uniref:Uncharacterized protein n=1 Tax=Hevea brasiliensis TaxID=3981 RepID=A0A6A6LH11_HEVBR|nr:hypothetical protein GH714_031785 [Hevea brasiliensis]